MAENQATEAPRSSLPDTFRPDNAPYLWRPFSHVQVFSHCAEQRCLPSSALAIRSRCGFAEMWGIVRATARVPTPLHPTPALTMRRHYGIPLVVIVRAGVGSSEPDLYPQL